jgi:hypothetical protein
MTMTLLQADAATQTVVRTLVTAYEQEDWERIRYLSRWTPAGDVGSDDFWISCAGVETKRSPKDLTQYLSVSRASKQHWDITQALGLPRWYKMTVTVERSGKFSVEFEYKDDYKEGDIMQRG